MADIIHEGITLEAFMALGSDVRVEVIDGVVVEMTPIGVLHHLIAGNFYRILDEYVRQQESGVVFFHGLPYLLHFKGKFLKSVQVLDVSFVDSERIPANLNLDLPFPAAPNLAIEVVSPDDDAELLLVRVRRYLKAGPEVVLVAYPNMREVHEYRQRVGVETVRVYKGDEMLDLEALFPGLRLTLTDIFTLPEWAQK